MVSQCPNCGKSFETAKGMRVHRADCTKKDPFGTKRAKRAWEKVEREMKKAFRF